VKLEPPVLWIALAVLETVLQAVSNYKFSNHTDMTGVRVLTGAICIGYFPSFQNNQVFASCWGWQHPLLPLIGVSWPYSWCSICLLISKQGLDCVTQLNLQALICEDSSTGWDGVTGRGKSGHGFLMASDNFTKHPSGPAMFPML